MTRTMLDKFSHIQVEYHYGFRDLKKHLVDANFAVSHTNPKYENGMDLAGFMLLKSKADCWIWFWQLARN